MIRNSSITVLSIIVLMSISACIDPGLIGPDPPDPDDSDEWELCAREGSLCEFDGTAVVRYGAQGSYFYQEHTGEVLCTNAVFGDPLSSVENECHYSYTAKVDLTPPPTEEPGDIDYGFLYDDSLVFFAGFDGSLGIDSSVYGRNGEASSDVSRDAGRFGYAARFDGSAENSITFPYDPALGLSDAITLSAWVYREGDGQQSVSVIVGRPFLDRPGHQQYSLGLNADNEIRWRLRFGSDLVNVFSDPIPERKWTHVVGTYDGAVMRLYIDGELSSERSRSGSFNAVPAPLLIGTDPDADGRRYAGRVDEIALYDTALTPDEVSLLYGLESGLRPLIEEHVERGETPVDPPADPPSQPPDSGTTVVSIQGSDWYINGVIINKGSEAEGLLLNARMVQATFEDENPLTVSNWRYEDGSPYHPERNTDEFIQMVPAYASWGLNAVTVSLQGGRPLSGSQVWINSAFNPDGSLKDHSMRRMARVIEALDENGMVAILSYFYFGQDQNFNNEEAVFRATREATDWVVQQGYTNVIIEIVNEAGHRHYDQGILKDPDSVYQLVELAHERSGGTLLVSASLGGGHIPPSSLVRAADYHLLHGNNQNAARVAQMVDQLRAMSEYDGEPIVFNEDSTNLDNMRAAVGKGAGWGYYDQEGFQTPPTNWMIDSPEKRAFFELVRELTTPEDGVCTDGVYVPNSQNQIIMEAESAELEGSWYQRNDIPGAQGDGHVVYLKNSNPNDQSHRYDGESELTYRFQISRAGTYIVDFRGARYDDGSIEYISSECPRDATDCTRNDLNNDIFLGIPGKSPTKAYLSLSSSRNSWRMGARFDDSDGKYTPEMHLEPGVHEITIRGRSNFFALDRIYVYLKGNQPSATGPESNRACI